MRPGPPSTSRRRPPRRQQQQHHQDNHQQQEPRRQSCQRAVPAVRQRRLRKERERRSCGPLGIFLLLLLASCPGRGLAEPPAAASALAAAQDQQQQQQQSSQDVQQQQEPPPQQRQPRKPQNLTIGYLTAIKGELKDRQGLAISGAFSMALDEAEELNTIVGNAFRMAYVAQLQRGQPMLQDVIGPKSPGAHFRKDSSSGNSSASNSSSTTGSNSSSSNSAGAGKQEAVRNAAWVNKSLVDDSTNNNNNNNSNNNNSSSGSSNGPWQTSGTTSQQQKQEKREQGATTTSPSNSSLSEDGGSSPGADDDMNLQLGSANSPTLRLSSVKTPNSIPGLRPSHNFGTVLGQLQQQQQHNGDDTTTTSGKSCSQQSSPSSEESNSPTELNSYKRLADKPPLIKRLTMGLTGGRDVLGLNGEDDSCPLVSGGSTPTSPTTTRPHSGGYINEAIIESDNGSTTNTTTRPSQQQQPQQYNGKLLPATESLDNTINSSINAKNFNIENNRLAQNSLNAPTDGDFKSKRRSQISTSSSSVPGADGSVLGSTPTPPPLPERTDSLNNRSEEGELRRAPWFQAGIPREITLEVLSQEPEGAFMVRESTSKPGCYALSLRVPREFQPSGIAHYLIMRTNKGYKIKGFTKEFTTLTSLITHHSVMPELLPCPLSLSRYNPSFVKADSHKDFADIDSDPDYNTLADFRKMMADLNV